MALQKAFDFFVIGDDPHTSVKLNRSNKILEFKLVGACMCRTGTMSLQEALALLGLRTYHMKEVLLNGHQNAWCMVDGGEIDQLKTVLSAYNANVDVPSACYWREILQIHPDAKVILTVRDPEKWYASCMDTVWSPGGFEFHWSWTILPMFRRLQKMSKMYRERFLMAASKEGDVNTLPKKTVIEAYERYIADVKAVVPSKRLLVFKPTDGWEPLCNFLDLPLPGKPFPHINDADELKKIFTIGRWVCMGLWVVAPWLYLISDGYKRKAKVF